MNVLSSVHLLFICMQSRCPCAGGCEPSDSLQPVKLKPSFFMTSLILSVTARGLYRKIWAKNGLLLLEVYQMAFHHRCNAALDFCLLNTFSQLPIISPNKTTADCVISFSLKVFLFRKTCFKCNKKGP